MHDESFKSVSLAATFMLDLHQRLNRELHCNDGLRVPMRDVEKHLLHLVRRAESDAGFCWMHLHRALVADRSPVSFMSHCHHLFGASHCVKCGERHEFVAVPDEGSLSVVRVGGKVA